MWRTQLRPLVLACAAVVPFGLALAAPHVPRSDADVLAELPPGAWHSPSRDIAATRLDVALPLAQIDISRARAAADLRYLGYAEALLAPWMSQPSVPPQVLILEAGILQSRHAFEASLALLDRALKARPEDVQAWLIRATVLRVLGRYDEALQSCERLAASAQAGVSALCTQSLRGLTGHLGDAYRTLESLSPRELPRETWAWRDSELGEMAERHGDDAAAERWFRDGLEAQPEDLYMRGAWADVMLRHGRAAETLELLHGYESMEPMMLRIAIAHRLLRDGQGAPAEALLSTAFDLEQKRGDAVHRREQARFLLDVDDQPLAALEAAEENWRVQREPEDILILLRAAQAAHRPDRAEPARRFLQTTGLEDARAAQFRGAI